MASQDTNLGPEIQYEKNGLYSLYYNGTKLMTGEYSQVITEYEELLEFQHAMLYIPPDKTPIAGFLKGMEATLKG